MKTASRDLFDLIQLMTASEKRYFQQYAQRHSKKGANQYVQLFNAISLMPSYNEAALKLELKDSDIIKHFAVTKRYLHEQILDSLHHYHLNQEVEEKILKELHINKILLKKKLTAQAEKRIAKVRKLIEEYQLWNYSPLIVELERKLFRLKRLYKKTTLETSEHQYKDLLLGLQKENFYWSKSQQIIGIHLQKVKLQNTKQKEELEGIVQELLAAGPPKNPIIQIDYLKALATYHFMKSEVESAAKYNHQLLELFEHNPYLMRKEKELYIASFNNYLIDNHILGKYDELEIGINKLRTLSKDKSFRSIPNMETKILELTYSLQLNARIKQNQFSSALELLPELIQLLHKHKDKIAINYKLSFSYLMAYIYYHNKYYEESLEQLELLKKTANKKLMQELQYAADRLTLINHLALSNYRLLESLVDNIRRTHREQEVNSQLENILFKGIKKVATAANKGKRTTAFQKMKAEILAVKQKEARAWNYFNFDIWELG